ncbi:hypothetical protein OR16_04762 [Cupriavidus basilensis OR16]|uniref:Uncharacterized protein n=1 Tax=Cupriavidus basilensis OR16 TaxID=1127483 RepID=H1S044_9BURK|nr:hypothetical protein [Cupriavidus basilensis]EHP44260.1 hypothetical protein OR16_04762 [Cupriavidus basilensis OR16]
MKNELIGYPNKRIDAAYHLRSPAPDDVWNHRDYETWRADIWKLIQDFANEEVQTAFLARPPEYVVGDDLSWLDEIIADVLDIDVDSKTQLAQRLRGRYRAIRAVHGTKTSDLDPFYREGLEPLAPERFHAQAKKKCIP